jgi:hypothetical protein
MGGNRTHNSRSCSRGSIDICARLSIWNTGVGPLDHGVGAGILGRHYRQGQVLAIVPVQQIEGASDGWPRSPGITCSTLKGFRISRLNE